MEPKRRVSEEIMVPRRLMKEKFAANLKRHMAEKGHMTQAELARAANIKKDSVNTYYHGRTLPDQRNLAKIAKVFGVDPVDLLPSREMQEAMEKPPALELRQTHDDPTRVWLRVDQAVTHAQAAKIVAVLSEDK